MRFLILVILLIALCHISNAQTYAITADRMIDGKSDKEILNPTIIVYKNKIVSINFNKNVPDSAQRIDLAGYTVLPGLIDAHTHVLLNVPSMRDYDTDLYRNSNVYRSLRAVAHLRTSLQNGFTTFRDVCTEGAGYSDVDLARAINQGLIEGPRLYTSGPGIAATGRYVPMPMNQNWERELPSGTTYVTGIDECRKAVREQVSHGVTWIKVFVDWGEVSFTQDELLAIVQEANRLNVQVAAHATSREGIALAINCKVKSIEHGDEFTDELIQKAIGQNISWCPTVTSAALRNADLSAKYEMINKANKLGMSIVLGSDAGSYPWTINPVNELIYYVKGAKVKPMDAIKMATSGAAKLLARDDLGRLSANSIADIIAVKGNPLDQIDRLLDVEFVMKGGVVVSSPDTEKKK